jgi:hypothetical protein
MTKRVRFKDGLQDSLERYSEEIKQLELNTIRLSFLEHNMNRDMFCRTLLNKTVDTLYRIQGILVTNRSLLYDFIIRLHAIKLHLHKLLKDEYNFNLDIKNIDKWTKIRTDFISEKILLFETPPCPPLSDQCDDAQKE